MAQLLIPSILPLNNTFTGSNTYALTAIPSTVEVFATYSISDDATGRMYIENSTVSDSSYTPQIRGVTGGTTRGMVILGQGTTDSGTTPLLEFRGRIGTVTNATTRPLFTWTNNLTTRAVMSANGNLTLGSTAGTAASAIYVTTLNSIYSLLTTTSTATLATITGGLTVAANLVSSAYVSDGYTAGLTWSSTDDNAAVPKAGVFSRTTAGGSYVFIGTSNAYASGITHQVSFTPTGGVDCAAITATSLVVTSSVTSGTALQVIASSLTSGRGAYVYSNSSSTSSFVLLDLTNANASAIGAIPLAIGNLAPTSTNYFRMMYLGGNAGANYLWKANGVSPSGNLSGTTGDICIGADSGKAYYCTSGTSWTAM